MLSEAICANCNALLVWMRILNTGTFKMTMLRSVSSIAPRLLAAFGILLSLTLISGCASIVTGQDQIVSVDTPLCPTAKCKLQNEEGVYWVPSTPGTISVDREYGDLVVTCSKPGYPDAMMNVSSSTKGMAFGNIILGGIIGAGVDMGTGAAYDYPSDIVVPLDCRDEVAKAAAPTSGQFSAGAAKLIDSSKCESPQFAFMDGTDEIYKSRCEDGRTGVIRCTAGGCTPLNISSPVAANTVAMNDVGTGKHEFSALKTAKQDGCPGSVKLVDKDVTKETYLAKCEDGSSRAVECEFGNCEARR
jgi:hypothetical protein